jgi:hypothetical protein
MPLDIFCIEKALGFHALLVYAFSDYPGIQMKQYRVGIEKALSFHALFSCAD